MLLSVVLLSGLLTISSGTFVLKEQFSWNALDWNYPDEFTRQQAIERGELIPENALPVGIERWKNKMFVTVPRWKAGIPATLNYIPLDAAYNPSPKLTPYPSGISNQLGNCMEGLQTVYRIKVDKCDRLWVLDTGTYGYDPNVTNLCPYALNVYDLNTDRRIRRYVLRPDDIVPTTFIANIAIDIGNSCDDTYAYFSDELGYGLIAYSWEQNRSWRFTHNFFMPDPLLGDFNIGGLNFNWGTEGIFGIALSPIGVDGFRKLFFSPLASHTEFSVSTKILRNENNAPGNYRDFEVVGTRGSDSHLTAKVFDDNGIQLYNLIDQNAIGCWNQARPYKPQNLAVVDRDDVGLVFPSDIKIDEDRNVWVMSEKMPVFLESTLDYSDINFRIYTAPLDLLLQGTVCEPSLQQQKLYPPQKVIRLPNLYNRLALPQKITQLPQTQIVQIPQISQQFNNVEPLRSIANLPNNNQQVLPQTRQLWPPINQNIIPSYLNTPSQASVPYNAQRQIVRQGVQPRLLLTSQPAITWWTQRPSYQVSEPLQ